MADEKKAFRINIVDILITFIIIAILTVGILMLANAFDVKVSGDDTAIVEYTVQFKNVRDEFKGHVQIGDTVIDSQKRQNLGEVVWVNDNDPYTLELYKADTDERVSVNYPDFINIEMIVRAEAYSSDGMWYLKESGKEIGIGTPLYINLPNFCGTGYISQMNIIK